VPGLLGDGVRPPTTKLRGTREPTESRGVLKASEGALTPEVGALTPEVREQRGKPGVVADVEPERVTRLQAALFFLCDGPAAYEKRYTRPGTTLGTPPTSVCGPTAGLGVQSVKKERKVVASLFTEADVKAAVKSLQNKAPGEDGVPMSVSRGQYKAAEGQAPGADPGVRRKEVEQEVDLYADTLAGAFNHATHTFVFCVLRTLSVFPQRFAVHFS
jgi:hypothetical protein